MADKEQPHWTSSLPRPPCVTPFPGMGKEARKLDTDVISIPVALTAMPSLNKDFLFFHRDTVSCLKKTGETLGRHGRCPPGMLQSQD